MYPDIPDVGEGRPDYSKVGGSLEAQMETMRQENLALRNELDEIKNYRIANVQDGTGVCT